MIRSIFDWIIDKRLSFSEAFKLMDVNFDGVVSPSDLQAFLERTFNLDVSRHRLKVDRVFKIMDHSKAGSILRVDFENTFSKVFRQE